jgi:hypothetical protein
VFCLRHLSDFMRPRLVDTRRGSNPEATYQELRDKLRPVTQTASVDVSALEPPPSPPKPSEVKKTRSSIPGSATRESMSKFIPFISFICLAARQTSVQASLCCLCTHIHARFVCVCVCARACVRVCVCACVRVCVCLGESGRPLANTINLCHILHSSTTRRPIEPHAG